MPAQSACLSRANRLRRTARSLPPAAVLACLVALAAAGGCHSGVICDDGLAEHILPPPGDATRPPSPEAPPSPRPDVADKKPPTQTDDAARQETVAVASADCKAMSLTDAIATAFRLQPRLRVYLEGVEQARGGEQIAFAPFLPTAAAGYSAGGFDVNAGGLNVLVGTPPAFTFIPALGAVPIGLNINTGYELAEVNLQWLICDFGRRLGRYRQAEIAVDVAQLQSEAPTRRRPTKWRPPTTRCCEPRPWIAPRRRPSAAPRTTWSWPEAEEGRCRPARKCAAGRGGAGPGPALLDAAEAAAVVAGRSLNLAIGLNVSAPTVVQDVADAPPPFNLSLADCLQTAVSRRREFQVARSSIEAAQQGVRAARADFAPRIVAEGYANDFQQAAPRGHADLAVGFIKLEWGLFEGGKRVGELRTADAKVPRGRRRGRVGRGPHRLPGQRGLQPNGRRAQGDRPRPAGGGPGPGDVSPGSRPLQGGGGDAVGHHRRGDGACARRGKLLQLRL